MTRVPRLRIGVGLLLLLVAALGAAAAVTSLAVYNRHVSLERSSRYDVAFSANQGVHELVRLTQRIAGALNPVAAIGPEEVALRHAILLNRLSVMGGGEFREFAAADPERMAFLGKLAEALNQAEPLIEQVREPAVNRHLLELLMPLEGELVQLAAEANEYGGARVYDDHLAVLRLHWAFTGIAGGLIGTGLLSVAMVAVRNRRFDAALRNMTQGLCMLAGDGTVVVANARFSALFGLGPVDTIAGEPAGAVFAKVAPEKCPVDGPQQLLQGEFGKTVLELLDGTVVQVVRSQMPHNGSLITYEDVTERIAAQKRIEHMARHDTLTGLPNRVGMRESLERAFYKFQRRNERFALLCLDLDGFKGVNDTLGHPAGDLLLKQVADTLRATVRADDVACRLGGDEFVVIEASIEGADAPESLARRLITALSRPFAIGSHQVTISTSVGIAVAPENGLSPEELLQHADSALYRAKQLGKSNYVFFDKALQTALVKRRETEQDLRKASFDSEFSLEYQVQVHASDCSVVGAEALLRWRNPRRGVVSPSEFIAIAEETGTIEKLGAWALKRACLEAASWPSAVRLAVNVSPAQFRRGSLEKVIQEALTESGLSPTRLELEITESLVLAEDPHIYASIARLADLGISVALDDFGTGYSSLRYLTRFPISRVKVDRAFITGISANEKNFEIVRAVGALGHALGLVTLAEGVETWSDLDLVKAAGYEEAQGYLFSQPLAADEIRELLRSSLAALREVGSAPPKLPSAAVQ